MSGPLLCPALQRAIEGGILLQILFSATMFVKSWLSFKHAAYLHTSFPSKMYSFILEKATPFGMTFSNPVDPDGVLDLHTLLQPC